MNKPPEQSDSLNDESMKDGEEDEMIPSSDEEIEILCANPPARLCDDSGESLFELLTRVRNTRRKLSKGQRAISDYILEHYDKAAFMTAAKLGQSVGVSESTAVRFAIALGYDGYPALQKDLREMIRNRLTSAQRVELIGNMPQNEILDAVLRADIRNIRRTLEECDHEIFSRVVEKLFDARRLYVLGVRSSAPVAQFLGYYLNFLLDNVTVVTSGLSDVMEQIIRIGEGDVLLGVSFPRYSVSAIEAMRYARSRGACVIALTDTAESPVGQAAELCLTARSDIASFVDSLVAPLSLVNALMAAMSVKRRGELGEYFDRLEGLWSENKVYNPDA